MRAGRPAQPPQLVVEVAGGTASSQTTTIASTTTTTLRSLATTTTNAPSTSTTTTAAVPPPPQTTGYGSPGTPVLGILGVEPCDPGQRPAGLQLGGMIRRLSSGGHYNVTNGAWGQMGAPVFYADASTPRYT
jgi:hypothetical protein